MQIGACLNGVATISAWTIFKYGTMYSVTDLCDEELDRALGAGSRMARSEPPLLDVCARMSAHACAWLGRGVRGGQCLSIHVCVGGMWVWMRMWMRVRMCVDVARVGGCVCASE